MGDIYIPSSKFPLALALLDFWHFADHGSTFYSAMIKRFATQLEIKRYLFRMIPTTGAFYPC